VLIPPMCVCVCTCVCVCIYIHAGSATEHGVLIPPTLSLTADKLDSGGVYPLDNVSLIHTYICVLLLLLPTYICVLLLCVSVYPLDNVNLLPTCICVLLLYMCPCIHSTTSAYYLHICPLTTCVLFVSSYYVSVLLLYMCPCIHLTTSA